MDIDIWRENNKRYGIIYSDPAWPQTKGNLRSVRPNQKKELDYQTLTLQEIIDIHEQAITLCDDKHNIFMWTIDKYLMDAEWFMHRFGYELHARIIWDKGNGIAPAFTVRFSHEYLLWFYKKGKMLKPRPEARGKYTTVIRENSTTHSHKPVAAYEMIDDMFPDTEKLELFARNHKDGWDCWGNETELFPEIK